MTANPRTDRTSVSDHKATQDDPCRSIGLATHDRHGLDLMPVNLSQTRPWTHRLRPTDGCTSTSAVAFFKNQHGSMWGKIKSSNVMGVLQSFCGLKMSRPQRCRTPAPICAARSRARPGHAQLAPQRPRLPDQLRRLKLELPAELPSLHGNLRLHKTPDLGVH